MGPVGNAILGVAFFVLAAAATLLMYHLWGYPFDKEKLRSEAPRPLMLLHRVLGFAFFGIYIYLMVDMVPRLWSYQIELPPRTVVHLTLGMFVGAALVLKMLIVRFFRHLESSLAPPLGTAVMIGAAILIGLSAPAAIREAFATSGEVYEAANMERVRSHLALAGLEDEGARNFLATEAGLRAGREVLSNKCVECHDLRTVLARPKTPKSWRDTVRRMAGRSTLLSPISEQEQWRVTAYLIAISPDLQKSAGQQRMQRQLESATQASVSSLPEGLPDGSYDAGKARELFESRCSQCHPATMIEIKPPGSAEDVRQLVTRMASNGLAANEEELSLIVRYISDTYAR